MRTGSRLRVDKKQTVRNLTPERRAAGRPPGRENNTTLEGRAICQKIVDDPTYRRNLRQRMLDGTAGQMEVLCWYYAYGKPKETLDVTKTEHTEHFHFYMPDNGRTAKEIIDASLTASLPMEATANGHALSLPANGRSGTD
jgi:hypothetical protein